jgi:epoxyqueuosine reductase QueG
MNRCPVGAITPKGHDKIKCREYLEQGVSKEVRELYGLEAYGCGLCQTKVPCESRIPTTKKKG